MKSSRVAWVMFVIAAATMAGSAYVFFHDFPAVVAVTGGRGEVEATQLLHHVFPIISDVGIICAMLWAVAGYALRRDRPWVAGVVGAALMTGLMAGFMPIPPTASRGVFPSSLFSVLLPCVLGYVLATRAGLRSGWKLTLLGLATAWAGQLSFMMGIASTHRIMTERGIVFLYSQRVQWLLLVGWFVVLVGLHAKRRWALSGGVGLGLASVVLGTPMGIIDAIALGRFSLFGVAPIWAAVMVVVFFRVRSAAIWAA
ncbi:MAG: hypothetical protein A2289_18475 [Deltaproteobacteria bacterium RIFOXYA12_FULL_58_15]|nr:MAG: hypothetical protein A2289_18475 [Deltaproteobacteria bacterium RIFOXYA12_FULL_58_15]OGR10595.1 MAG: hypothetical protein A2341_09605 [Deltaproteobacteria bacterium RIFOXYB12_FULL_58_9]